MDNDNIYPVSSERFFTPRKAKKEDEKSVKETLDQVPLLKDVLKHLDERIAAADSVKESLKIKAAYGELLDKDPVLVAMDIVRQQIETERGYIHAKVNDLAKR